MVEPVSTLLGTAIGLLVKSAPGWFASLRDTLVGKGKEFAGEQVKGRVVGFLDEKKHLKNMELALKNAAERGLRTFQTPTERDQYRSILEILAGADSEALRQEAMQLLTYSDNPDMSVLAEKYNLRRRISAMAQYKTHEVPQSDANMQDNWSIRGVTQGKAYEEVDAAPYLSSFFEALIAELYNDPLFREQMSDVIKVRAAVVGQRTLEEILFTLSQISENIIDDYTIDQLERDIETYTNHIERTLHYLKLVGVVPKDRGEKNADPELHGIFVPLRIALEGQGLPQEELQDSITASLEHFPYLVLLGGPGSGKSTAVRYLAWSHAAANQSEASVSNISLLSGNPPTTTH